MGEYTHMHIDIKKNRLDDFIQALQQASGDMYMKDIYKDTNSYHGSYLAGEIINARMSNSYAIYSENDDIYRIDASVKWLSYMDLKGRSCFRDPYKAFMKACEIMGNVTLEYDSNSEIDKDDKSFTVSYDKPVGNHTMSDMNYYPILRFMANSRLYEQGAVIPDLRDMEKFCVDNNIHASVAPYNIYNVIHETGKKDDFTKEDFIGFISKTYDRVTSLGDIYMNRIEDLLEKYQGFAKYINSVGTLDYMKEHGLPEKDYEELKYDIMRDALLSCFAIKESDTGYVSVKEYNDKLQYSLGVQGFNRNYLGNEKVIADLDIDIWNPGFNMMSDVAGAVVLYDTMPKVTSFRLIQYNNETDKFTSKKYDTLKECIENMTDRRSVEVLKDFIDNIHILQNARLNTKKLSKIMDISASYQYNDIMKKLNSQIKTLNDRDKTGRIYLNVPYSEKDEAKSHGAKWDSIEKKWYCNEMNDSLKKWAGPEYQPKEEDFER